jgi:hypothetical protein
MTSTASASDSDQAFLGVAALLFVASAATTSVERVLPAGERVARMLGVVIIAIGLLLIVRT